MGGFVAREVLFTRFTAEMLYIPERDSCTVWTANNTPLQRDSETLYWFPSSADIDCWQVRSSHDDDTWTWHKHPLQHTSSGIVGFPRAPCTLCGARHPLKCKSLFCQSIEGSPAHSPSTRRNLLSAGQKLVVGTGGKSGHENLDRSRSLALCALARGRRSVLKIIIITDRQNNASWYGHSFIVR